MPEAALNDCWNKIGIWGQNSCPELEKYVHCRNCPIYSSAAAQLLDGILPELYVDEWTGHLAEKKHAAEPDTRSAVIFRLGVEWLALSTEIFKEIADWKTIHSLPHRRGGIVLGLANIRGELLICVSLAGVLHLEEAAEGAGKTRAARPRLLVVGSGTDRLVFPVDEVGGIHHFSPKEVRQVPSTIAGAASTYTQGLIAWEKKSVGCLDDELLLYTLNKNLS